MRELLQELDFSDRVHAEAVFEFGLDFDLFDGDEGGGGGAVVAEIDDGVGTFAELFICLDD